MQRSRKKLNLDSQNKILNFWKSLDIQKGVLYGKRFQY